MTNMTRAVCVECFAVNKAPGQDARCLTCGAYLHREICSVILGLQLSQLRSIRKALWWILGAIIVIVTIWLISTITSAAYRPTYFTRF